MPPRIAIDKNRILNIDGEPFFLVGARHIPEGGSPRILAEAGFNAYRALAFGSETAEPDPLPGKGDDILFWSYIFDRTVFSRSSDYERELRDHVQRVKQNRALLCYENFNEPAKISHWQSEKNRAKAQPEEILEGTNVLRKIDPDHPIWLAHNFQRAVKTLAQYNDCADIIGSNCYPVMPEGGIRKYLTVRNDGKMIDSPDQTIHAVGGYTGKIMQVVQGRKPVWMLLQAMANASWIKPENTPLPEERVIDESKYRYPTYQELRFMVYDAVITGATGIALSMFGTPVDGPVWEDITRVVRELRRLSCVYTAEPVDISVELNYTDIGYTIWDGVKILARRYGGDLWLLAANTAFDPAEVSFRVKGTGANHKAVVEGEDREIPVERGTFADSFAPYDVHVYKFSERG